MLCHADNRYLKYIPHDNNTQHYVFKFEQTPTQVKTTNPTSHLYALPAVTLRTLYSTGTVERTYRGSCHRIYCKNVPKSRHPSHSVIDIIVDCFLVLIMNCLLFLFNVLLLIYLL